MLRKLLLATAIFSACAMSSQAQDYTVISHTVDSFTVGSTPCLSCTPTTGYPNTVTVNNKVTNASSTSPLTISWRIVSSVLPTGWVNTGVCDNNQCFGDSLTVAGVTTHNTNPIAAGGSCTFQGNFYVPTTGANGTGTIKVKLTTLSQSDTLVFNVNKTPTGISVVSLKDNRVALYPNPASANNLFVYADKALNASHITVVNIMGQTVLSTDLSKSAEVTDLNINALAKGSYFVRIVDTKGQLVTARQFIKN
jgi:hypothetical protein